MLCCCLSCEVLVGAILAILTTITDVGAFFPLNWCVANHDFTCQKVCVEVGICLFREDIVPLSALSMVIKP